MAAQTKKLVVFFVATFAWTWGFYAPIVSGHHNPYQMPWTIFLILGGMGPSLVGVGMLLLTCDRKQQRDFWRRCFSPRRIDLRWWGVILIIFPLIFGLSIAIGQAAGSPLPGAEQLKSLIVNPAMWPLAAFISYMSGPWSEEFGWRGYALERLIQRMGALPGSLLLGLIWAVWHLPLYFMTATWHAQMGFKLAGFWSFMLMSVGLSLLMTCVFLNTQRSILAGMLMHFTSNFTAQLISPVSDQVEILRSLLILAAGIGGCMLFLPKYPRDSSEPIGQAADVLS
jgi:uncharacterized protein